MAEENFVHKTLDKMLDVIEVELKLPLGFAEVKISPTAIAKEWRENQKKRNELENAIQRAEDKFIEDNKDNKVAQMLHEFPLYSEEEFKQVIANLLTHLSEEKITWLAEVQLTKTWGNVANGEDIRKALELYLPYLRHELSGIKEFREVISALTLERIDETTRRIESKLDQVLDKRISKGEEEPDFWFIPHPYPMPPNFTGRKTELQMLDNWLADNTNRLFILRALGGFGKSALAWQWINTHVNPAEYPKLVWWSFYEGDASFEHFIEETLKYLKLEVPQGQRPQVDALLQAMQSQKILLIMDGFERLLKAYRGMSASYQGDEELNLEENQFDCVDINVEWFLKGICARPNFKSKVLITTRLTPRTVLDRHSKEIVLGCREKELTSMQPADAVEFFHKQKIKGTHAEIEVACAPYGYHPLSLRLLAGRILKDFENPADIIVARKLKIDGDSIQQKHHVLEVSYNSLSQHEQKFLSTIACFRSPVELQTLEAIVENKNSLNDELHDLVTRGLLHFDEKNKKFDLHPIVRLYAYEQLPQENRKDTHIQLAMHFIDIMPITNRDIKKLEDLAAVIELFHHIIKAGQFDKAKKIFKERLDQPIFFQFGAYHLQIELLQSFFLNGEDEPPTLTRDHDKGQILNDIAAAYSLSGQPQQALVPMQNALQFAKMANEEFNVAIGLTNIAETQLLIGALNDAEHKLLQVIDVYGVELIPAIGHLALAYSMLYRGLWQDAMEKLDFVAAIQSLQEEFQIQSVYWINRGLCFLFMAQLNFDFFSTKFREASILCAQRAIDAANEQARIHFPIARDFIRAHWLLGNAYHLDGQLDFAEKHLNEALTRDRAINLVQEEANILLDLARLRYDQKNYEEAQSLVEEALSITERCGYVLQGADVNLFLAQYALEQEQDKVKARQYAEEARKLATCDGPPYYYKVAYEEAERMLKALG